MTRKRKHPHPDTWPKGWITITQAASILEYSYQRTRDLILAKRCGEVKISGVTKLVSDARVRELKKQIDDTRQHPRPSRALQPARKAP